MRPDWDSYFMKIASAVSERSTCDRAMVGCVLVLEKRILTTGFNGSPIRAAALRRGRSPDGGWALCPHHSRRDKCNYSGCVAWGIHSWLHLLCDSLPMYQLRQGVGECWISPAWYMMWITVKIQYRHELSGICQYRSSAKEA